MCCDLGRRFAEQEILILLSKVYLESYDKTTGFGMYSDLQNVAQH